MRPLITLLLLLIGMSQLLPLGQQGLGAESLLAFGFLIMAASTVGDLVARIGLPKIVGYMFAGIVFGPLTTIVFGPGVFQVLPVETVRRLAPVSALAIALIAFLAGAELRWTELKQHGTALLKILTVELLLTFVVLAGAMFALTTRTALLPAATLPEALAFSLLFASIAVAHSPAATLALLSETKARGPIARTTLGVVLLSDVAVVLLFTIAAAVARSLAPARGMSTIAASSILWEILGAVLVGGVLGLAVAIYLRFVRRELLLFGILIAFLGSEIARLAHVEVLLTLLVAGFITENLSAGSGDELRHAIERAAAPIFVVFFAVAGAAIDLRALSGLAVFVFPLVVARAAGITLGTRLGARWARVPPLERKLVGHGLIAQAGVAIGLATLVGAAYPVRGAQLQAMLLATIAVNQVLGPILFRRALLRAGEIHDETEAQPAEWRLEAAESAG